MKYPILKEKLIQLEGETKLRILKTAEILFSEKGFEGTTTREIAETAGVNKAMIFYYFKNKEELYFEVLNDMFTSLTRRLYPIFKASMPYKKKIEKFVGEVFDYLASRPTFCKITQRESINPRERYKNFVISQLKPLYEEGKKFLKKKGKISDADNFIFSGYGMIMSYFNEAIFFGILMGKDPMDPMVLAKRKEHIKKVLLKLAEEFTRKRA